MNCKIAQKKGYITGFGVDEINKELSKDLLEISENLSKNISIEICFDIQKNIKVKSFDNVILYKKESNIRKLKELRKNVKNYLDKKLIIIQSNVTNVYKQINIFPLNTIISKSDPIPQLVFTLRDKNKIDVIKNSGDYYRNIINHEKFKGEMEGIKEKRLNNNLNELNKKLNFIMLLNE